MVDFSKPFQFSVFFVLQSYNPKSAVTNLVWAPSISLAATLKIDVSFFSSSYLDVSVQRVSPLSGDRPSACRVVPFGYSRIKSRLQIPANFRSLPRPSSPPRAKASPIRSFLLSSPQSIHSHALTTLSHFPQICQ